MVMGVKRYPCVFAIYFYRTRDLSWYCSLYCSNAVNGTLLSLLSLLV